MFTVSNHERSLFLPAAVIGKKHIGSEAEKRHLNPFSLMTIHTILLFSNPHGYN